MLIFLEVILKWQLTCLFWSNLFAISLPRKGSIGDTNGIYGVTDFVLLCLALTELHVLTLGRQEASVSP